MKNNFSLLFILLLAAAAILSACGPMTANAQDQIPADAVEVIDVETDLDPDIQDEIQPENGAVEPTSTQQIFGWLGTVISLPEDSLFDDYLVLSPEGTGEIGVTGATAEIEEQIIALRDKPEPGKFAHFWGTLTCDGSDYNGCQLTVTHIRSGATNTEPEPVDGWKGTLISSTFNGGDSTVFVLDGEFPMWYSIHSNEPGLLEQLETLRQTNSVVRVWGELITGIPDVNASRIQVSTIEIVAKGELVEVSSNEEISIMPGWEEYCSLNYGYCLEVPYFADLNASGIHSVPTDEIPEGADLDSYIAQLEKTLGKDICIQIRTELAYLYISAPVNAQFKYAICGRTGVGGGEMVDKTEEVTLLGQSYTASGFEVNYGGETTDLYNETLVFTLEDGTRIEYGSLPRNDATFTDYEMKGKPIIFQILDTFRLAE